ncbi:hypothetical protein SNEBB_002897 [Seison nebaliae]|nr:hypothetical protein SNEBB_002897 [Seison nebaliae]
MARQVQDIQEVYHLRKAEERRFKIDENWNKRYKWLINDYNQIYDCMGGEQSQRKEKNSSAQQKLKDLPKLRVTPKELNTRFRMESDKGFDSNELYITATTNMRPGTRRRHFLGQFPDTSNDTYGWRLLPDNKVKKLDEPCGYTAKSKVQSLPQYDLKVSMFPID